MATSFNNLDPNLISEGFGEDALHDNNGDVERPMGRKAEKAKRKRIKRPSKDVVVFMMKKNAYSRRRVYKLGKGKASLGSVGT